MLMAKETYTLNQYFISWSSCHTYTTTTCPYDRNGTGSITSVTTLNNNNHHFHSLAQCSLTSIIDRVSSNYLTDTI